MLSTLIAALWLPAIPYSLLILWAMAWVSERQQSEVTS